MLPASPPPSESGFHALFKNRPFLTLWSGQLLSQVADKVFFILLTLPLLVNYEPPTGWGENSMRSALMVAFTLPAMLFGSAAGIYVDRYEKKTILAGCNLVRGFLTLAILILPKEFAILVAIAFFVSILTQFFAPAEQAAIPLLVRHENLMSANALFTTTMMGALIVGFIIGEPLLAWARTWGEFGQELLVGGLYLIAAAVLYGVPIKEAKAEPHLVAAHPWNDFKAGLAYLRKDRLVSNAMVQLMILYSVFAALTVLAVNLADKIGLESNKYGLLAAAGIGMVFGAGTLGHWGDRFHHKPLPLIGFLIMALVLGLFTFNDSLPLGLGLSILLGIGASMVGVPMQTLVQQQTPESMRGKVFGFQNNIINIALSLPLAIAGPLTDFLGLRSVLLGISLIISIAGIWAWQSTRRVLQDVI